MDSLQWIALIIFIITYTGIIFTRLPWINIDRPSAAFFGSIAMILFGVLSLQEAWFSIDYNTIFLLLGMMIIITTLQLDGFFLLVARQTMKLANTRSKLLILITFISGIGSAFMVNDVIVLMFTPVIIQLCRTYKLNPLPYLIAEILASNIGSVMTITGNPQNMIVGINSGISYSSFLLHLLPISIVGLFLTAIVVKSIYRKEFTANLKLKIVHDEKRYNYSSMKISIPIFGAVIILFFLSTLIGISIPLIALLGAAMILIFGKIRPSEIIKEVDWILILFFATLFIVVRGIEKVGLLENLTQVGFIQNNLNGIGIIHVLSLVFSQIVSNVPFTIAFLPVLKEVNEPLIWLSQASASTLAGNATIIGAMANLIVIELARKEGIIISFWEFFKSGFIITLLTFILSIGVLALYLVW
jgi:Na+/H+ antiporter NhaD/arsenite permease-like protein